MDRIVLLPAKHSDVLVGFRMKSLKWEYRKVRACMQPSICLVRDLIPAAMAIGWTLDRERPYNSQKERLPPLFELALAGIRKPTRWRVCRNAHQQSLLTLERGKRGLLRHTSDDHIDR